MDRQILILLNFLFPTLLEAYMYKKLNTDQTDATIPGLVVGHLTFKEQHVGNSIPKCRVSVNLNHFNIGVQCM